MKPLKTLVLAASLVVAACQAPANLPSQPTSIEAYVAQIRKGKDEGFMSIVGAAGEEDVRRAIECLNDPSPGVQSRMLHFLLEFGRRQDKPAHVRTLAHDGVISVATRPDLSASTGSAAKWALMAYYRWELTPAQSERLIHAVRTNKILRSELVLLVGWAHGDQAKDRLKDLAKPALDSGTNAYRADACWSAVLALARGGDAEALALVLKVTDALRLDRDPASKYVMPTTYLGYVNQPQTATLLLEQLFSDAGWSNGHMRESAAAYAVDPLIDTLDRIPEETVKLDPNLDRLRRISALRQWARAQREFVVRHSGKTFTWRPGQRPAETAGKPR